MRIGEKMGRRERWGEKKTEKRDKLGKGSEGMDGERRRNRSGKTQGKDVERDDTRRGETERREMRIGGSGERLQTERE